MTAYARQVTQTVEISNDSLQLQLSLAERAGATKELLARLTVDLEDNQGPPVLSIADWVDEVPGVDAAQVKVVLVAIRNHLLAKANLTEQP